MNQSDMKHCLDVTALILASAQAPSPLFHWYKGEVKSAEPAIL